MSLETRQLHRETATAILTGIMINFPLNFSLLYLWVEVLEWNSAFKIAVCTTAIMTLWLTRECIPFVDTFPSKILKKYQNHKVKGLDFFVKRAYNSSILRR